MNQVYWVSAWAKRRQDEVVRVPAEYKIHTDFFVHMDKTEVQSAFLELNTLFQIIYGDIAVNPDAYGMPLNAKDSYRIFSREFTDSGQAPYRPFILLYNLSICGEIINGGIKVSSEKFKALKPPPKYLSGIDQKISRTNLLFNKLSDFGFVFEGLKNNKLTNSDISITYPDNPAMLYLLKQLADKAHGTKIIHNARSIKEDEDARNREVDRICDFLCCHFRLLQDDMVTTDYGFGADDVADRVLTDLEKEFVYKLDETLTSTGFVSELYGGIECHGIAYYHSEKALRSKKPYTYRIMTRGMDFEQPDDETKKLRLELRIRNVSNCLDYLTSCPDSVKRIFTDYSDTGCTARQNNACKHGVAYEINGSHYWRCACCGAAFNFKPELADISHYIKLIELGEKK